ncbi:soyasapogenol B glucuronide galactosyltransferase-like [Benincasa hispida]|uniref:soyasapogenol B glucuronide galactosyltransferase-like n=1 Tax=Benincasa hispida TaxID=102211 RepID=UPI0019015BEC|nr:soyasapogenol B glucuronide galactosyltransferase-like [Benincasa hispida]
MLPENTEFRITVLPLFASGHVIPIIDMARLFAHHGATVTIITTESNACVFQNSIDRDFEAGFKIQTHIVTFPGAEVGLAPGIENYSDVSSRHLQAKIYQAFLILDKLIDQEIIPATQPDCILSDLSHSWTTDTAERLGVPRLVVSVSNFMAYSAEHSVMQHHPEQKVASDTEAFEIPGLPHRIQMTKSQQPEFFIQRNAFTAMLERYKEAERRSYGTVMNTFYELDGVYLEHYKKIIGIKAWGIGPVSLAVNKDMKGKSERGNKSNVESEELLEWLNSKEPNSVLYVSFGSMVRFPPPQMAEIAHGLEDSGINFIWVIRNKGKNDGGEEEEGLPEGFEERIKNKNRGLIIRIWAPQLLILEHPSTGGFLTHCGWNSSIEGISAGKPMVTWPVSSEQFYTEKLLTEVLQVGVPVGAQWWWNMNEEMKEIVSREKVGKGVGFLMGATKEAVAIRKRAEQLGAAANRAVQSGGSSEQNLVSLMKELRAVKFKGKA